MKYFLDAEFIEDGNTIDLLSLGIVDENDREQYVVNSEADQSKANDWVKANVLPHLMEAPPGFIGAPRSFPRAVVRQCMLDFVGEDPSPQFWGYYADYDWVAFCQLFGTMMDLPKGFPMYCRDIKQLCDMLGNPKLPEQGKGEHHALLDARWNKQTYEFLYNLARAKVHNALANGTTAELLADSLNR